MRYAIILGLAVMLAGCAGYQPGSLLSEAVERRAEYCATADPERRAALLASMRAAGVPVPSSGACTDIIGEAVNKGLDVDVEQAEKDRARFE